MSEPSRLKAFFAGALLGAPILLGCATIATVTPTIAPGLEYLFGMESSSPQIYAAAALSISAILSLMPMALIRSARSRSATYLAALALIAIPAVSTLGIGVELAKTAAGMELI